MRRSQATARGGPGGKSTGETASAKLRLREKEFVNDAVAITNCRTRYHDIIPEYEATKDKHCQKYFDGHDISNATSRHKPVSAGLGV